MHNFSGQHVIITGGSSGIGKAIAILLAQAGANITLIARNPEKLKQAQAEVATVQNQSNQNQSDKKILTAVADVSHRVEAEQAIQSAIQHLGVPDILVTSAGIAHPGYFQELPIEVFEQTMAVNYFGSLYCIRAVLPGMQQQGRGRLVLISSGAGIVGIYGYTPYCPSKFALRGLAESLRAEVKPFGIQVTIVYPPDTATPQLDAENRTKPIETKQITDTTRIWQPEEIAQEILSGIQRDKFAIAPGLELTLLNRFHSVLAPILHWYFDRIVHNVRQRKVQSRQD
ncbi:MAG: SDR family oxidoreductase [Microcoleaceae cyanobacterium]